MQKNSDIVGQGRRGFGFGFTLSALVAFAACAPVNRSLGDDELAGLAGTTASGGMSAGSTGANAQAGKGGFLGGHGGSTQQSSGGATLLAGGGEAAQESVGGATLLAEGGAADAVGGATMEAVAGAGEAPAVGGGAGENCFSPDRPEGALSGEPGCACPFVALACSIVDAPPLIGFKRLLHFSCDGHWQLNDTGMCPGAKCLVNGQSYASGTTGVPDPFDCNVCTCWEGELINCSAKSSCAGQCPSGKKLANQCSECGPGIACSELQTGCFDTCNGFEDCSDGKQCVSGLCRRALCSGLAL